MGNWKLFKTVAEAQALVGEVKNQLAAIKGVHYGVAPSFPLLWPVARRIEDSAVQLAGQDCHWEREGAFTGEVSAEQLAEAGCQWVIVGHSERRTLFGETDEAVGKKAVAARRARLGVIICVGETERERDAGQTFAVVERQLDAALAPLGASPDTDKVVIAYEPVWAIGTGRTATPAQAQEVHAHIRKRLAGRYGAAASEFRIQYGGSVKASNAEALMAEPDIDGALVGGASLIAADFVAIVKAARPR
jgi:triosephosphate isomerase